MIQGSASQDGTGVARQDGTGVASFDDLSRQLAAAIDEREAVAEELKRVKRKYRRVTIDSQTAKSEVVLLTQQLAEAHARLAAIERRSLAAIVRRIVEALRNLRPRKSAKARRAEQIELVRKSHLFDADWYLAIYPDVAEARIDPAVHYLTSGWREGRDPGPDFSSSRYLKAHRDIADAGLNPFLHYLEHGMAEGRASGGGGSALPRFSIENFGPAAPVFRAPVELPARPRWARHYDLDPSRPHFRVGNWIGGYVERGAPHAVSRALDRFWRVSGLAGDPPLVADGHCDGNMADPALLDGWFAGHSRFRARWRMDGEAIVVRAFQRSDRGQPTLIGEALVTTSLDVTDFPAAHPLLPILFLACRPDGALIGATTLSFPSLCRGGMHYAESLIAGPTVSPAELGEEYARKLDAILEGEVVALVRDVRVDLAGADGTSPMFQSPIKDWLHWVMRVDVAEAVASASLDRAESRFLSDRASGAPAIHRQRSASPARLLLPSDSVPTIAAMLQPSGEGAVDSARACNMSMLIVHSDPALPAVAVTTPPAFEIKTRPLAVSYPMSFPLLLGAPAGMKPVPLAIRTAHESPLAESELLQPVAQPRAIVATAAAEKSVVVAIEPALWSPPELEASLAALRLQSAADRIAVCTIGSFDPQLRALIEREFPGRTTSRVNVHAFLDALDQSDILHLGAGVILHDRRTVDTFQSLLAEASSVSCPVLTSRRQGKSWRVGVADAGSVLDGADLAAERPVGSEALLLWRSIFPVYEQPRHLWAARPAALRDAPDEVTTPHLMCTWISSSYWGDVPEQPPTLFLPPAVRSMSICLEELAG